MSFVLDVRVKDSFMDCIDDDDDDDDESDGNCEASTTVWPSVSVVVAERIAIRETATTDEEAKGCHLFRRRLRVD